MAQAPARRTAIVIVAKAPIAGIAKTRLGRAIGFVEAARLYEAFLLDTLEMLETGSEESPSVFNVVGRWVTCPDISHASALAHIVSSGWSVVPQRRTGLMGALADSFEDGFAVGAEVVVIIDADSPGLPFAHVEECVRCTINNQVVLGPTHDGGYYLIAARRDIEKFATDVVLGRSYVSETICDDTIKHAEKVGLTTARGPIGFDVDTIEDLGRLIRDLPGRSPVEMQRTRAALAAIASIPGEPRRHR
ncbi:MAG TPA: DUF2064 domain-containing protein [Chloroflexota bacterium]|nr:DUF2064 domain-containing protein [Chloroflexota bacterium]